MLASEEAAHGTSSGVESLSGGAVAALSASSGEDARSLSTSSGCKNDHEQEGAGAEGGEYVLQVVERAERRSTAPDARHMPLHKPHLNTV